MPRPCAVESHVRCYKIRRKVFADATALRRGVSRSLLQNTSEGFCGCHGLAPWRLTLAAYKTRQKRFADATALRRGVSRSLLQNTSEGFCGCHGLAPWHQNVVTRRSFRLSYLGENVFLN